VVEGAGVGAMEGKITEPPKPPTDGYVCPMLPRVEPCC